MSNATLLTAGRPSASSAAGSSLPKFPVASYELPNGLNILVQPDFSAPVVTVQYWCGTGSIHEGRWLGAGLSHLLEHLMFKGTPQRGNSQLAQDVQDLGGHLNAYTSFDRTVYHVDLPAENWRQALEIWTDSMQHSLIPADQFEPEKEVIRREFAMGDDSPDSQLNKLAFRTAFTAHPYRFPVIGYLDLFNQITRQDVLDYYHQRYAPQNMTLIVAGAVEPQAVFDYAAELWAEQPRRWLPDPIIPDEPAQQSRRLARKAFPTEVTRLALLHHIPGLNHADIPALRILAIILGGGRSSRLHQQLVEKEGLAEEVDAFTYAPARIGLFGVDARCHPQHHEKVVERLQEELHAVRQQPPAEADLERAKRLCLTQQLHAMRTMSGKAGSIGSGWMLMRDPHFNQTFLQRLHSVTAVDVAQVAARYLHPETETRVELVPLHTAKIFIPPSTENHPTTTPQLARVVGNPRTITYLDSRLPLVSYRASLPGGFLTEAAGKSGLSRLASQMLLKGTQRRSAEQLAQEVEQLGGFISTDSGNNSASLSLELLSQDGARGLELFLEILTEPKFLDHELATEKRKQLAAIQIDQDRPMSVARDILRTALYGSHPYAGSVLGRKETVEALTLADVEHYVRTTFQSSSAILTAAGALDAENWAATLAAGGANLWRNESADSLPNPSIPPLTGPVRVEKNLPKEQAVLQIAFLTPALIHPDQIPLSMIGEALADLGTRLFVRIREQLGLAYFVSAARFLGTTSSYFCFYAGTDPKKKRQVEAAMLEEIFKMAHTGLTAVELHRAKAKLLSEEKIDAQNPSSVAAGAALDELLGLGYDFAAARRQRIAEMTLEELNAVAARYFSREEYVVATVSPE